MSRFRLPSGKARGHREPDTRLPTAEDRRKRDALPVDDGKAVLFAVMEEVRLPDGRSAAEHAGISSTTVSLQRCLSLVGDTPSRTLAERMPVHLLHRDDQDLDYLTAVIDRLRASPFGQPKHREGFYRALGTAIGAVARERSINAKSEGESVKGFQVKEVQVTLFASPEGPKRKGKVGYEVHLSKGEDVRHFRIILPEGTEALARLEAAAQAKVMDGISYTPGAVQYLLNSAAKEACRAAGSGKGKDKSA